MPSLGKCIEFLNNEGSPANQKTLNKYINTCVFKAYHGYICKYVKKKIFSNGVHIKILTICWNSLVSISTKSENLIGYAQSAGNQKV